MTKRRFAAAGLLALSAVAVVAFVRLRSGSSSSVSFTWPVGTQTVYEVDWVRSEMTSLAAAMGNATESPPIAGDLHLTADLVFRSLERRREGGYRLRVHLEGFTNHRFVLMGADVLPDEASVDQAFAGQAATVDIEPSGRIVSIGFVARTPQLFKHLMNGLLTEGQIVLDGETDTVKRSWMATAPTLIGVVRQRYTWSAAAPGSTPGDRYLERRQERYVSTHLVPGAADMAALQQDVASEGRITIGAQGQLVSLDESSAVTLTPPGAAAILNVKSALRWNKKGERPFSVTPQALAVAADATTDRHAPGELVVSAQADERLLQQRIGAMTVDQMQADLLAFPGGEMPEHSRWLWQTTGLLTLHPELCAVLVPVFERDGASVKTRNLILDLLASTGHVDAQKVMRQLIDFHAATVTAGNDRTSATHALYLQRLSLLARPDAASVSYIASVQRAAATSNNDVLKTASLYALGSVVGHAANVGSGTEVARYNEQLRNALAEASTAGAKDSGLRALGNAGLKENVSVVLPFSHDKDEHVRAAAATALRKTATPEAVDTLLSLLTDPATSVQSSALGSITAQPFNEATWNAVAGVVLSGKTSRALDADLTNMASANLDRPKIPEILRMLIARNADRPKLESRLRLMLDSLDGA